ncbi:hypothetical protein [Lacticaseibacillus parakribbianus]|uniref:hypothetical protein n=1 Tax=Lacticaseibacillus parakribbianus TaxID=2970927 RepID=UPI0021CB4318|nr:hypothetical protein [Lacticaseibacillus parakribbianus]
MKITLEILAESAYDITLGELAMVEERDNGDTVIPVGFAAPWVAEHYHEFASFCEIDYHTAQLFAWVVISSGMTPHEIATALSRCMNELYCTLRGALCLDLEAVNNA